MWFRGTQHLGLDSAALVIVFSLTHINSLAVKKGLVALFLQYFLWFRVKKPYYLVQQLIYDINMS